MIDITTELSFQWITVSTNKIVSRKSICRCGIMLRYDKFFLCIKKKVFVVLKVIHNLDSTLSQSQISSRNYLFWRLQTHRSPDQNLSDSHKGAMLLEHPKRHELIDYLNSLTAQCCGTTLTSWALYPHIVALIYFCQIGRAHV